MSHPLTAIRLMTPDEQRREVFIERINLCCKGNLSECPSCTWIAETQGLMDYFIDFSDPEQFQIVGKTMDEQREEQRERYAREDAIERGELLAEDVRDIRG